MAASNKTEKSLSQKRRSKGAERQKEEGGISSKDIAMFGAEMIPGVGEAMAVKRTSDALDKNDYLGAGIEATAGVLGIVPGIGDAAGKGLRAVTKKLRKDAKLRVDNPGYNEVYGETYAQTKQKYADEAKQEAANRGEKDTYEANLGTTDGITGFADNVKFKPEELKNLPGTMGEEKFRSSGEKLQRLKESIKKEGYNEDPIMIHVREDGQPFIVEGNHRLAEALESGRDTITADIRYLRGAEEKKGLLDPKNIFPDRTKMAEGGAVMQKQMEMFEDGGLKDEGGTVDPVSGNDVPPGSTQEEVRDDIPAQLSEGEFVFPADVVRYIGLGNLMRIRQEAKMGLKMMEEMGQMGNSDEATMPDDLPFDINDLDMEDEIENNKELEMQVGGFVPPTQQQQQMGISGYQQAAAPTTGVAAVPQQAASQQYVQPVQPVQAAVPTMTAYKPSEVPTFQQTIGDDAFGTYDELRQYKNEAGNIINIPFRNGQPISPIPEGYTFVDPEETATEEVTTTPTTPQTTTVREDKGDADHAMKEEEMYGPGGGRLAIGGTTYGVSFDGVKFGEMRSLLGGLATGKPVPDNVTVNFKRGDTTFRLKGSEYNDLKNKLNTPEGQTIVNNAIDRTDTQDRVKAVFNRYEDALASDDKATSQNAQKVVNEMIKEAKRKNIDKDTGMIINPFEANRPTGDETQQTTTPSAPPTTPEPTVGEGFAGYADVTGGPGQDDAPADSGFSMGSDFSASERDELGPGGYNQGGLASKSKPKKTKKKKKGGLASKK